jgi:hypothetical protein
MNMGYNTACIILNDQLHSFAKDPDVGEKVQHAVLTAALEGGRGPHGFMALQPEHADVAQVVVISGNIIKPLGYGHYRNTDEELLRHLADQHGFRLVRKPAIRAATLSNEGE